MSGDSTERGDGRREPLPTINVAATATVDAVPDEARLHFDLSADGRSSAAALEAVRKRLTDVDGICDRLDIATADRASTVSVSEHGERDGGRWLSKGYRAQAQLKVVVRDPEAVGPLVNEVVAAAGPAVRGPFWRISPDHPARLQACGKAAAHARAKADVYASSLGVALGDIVTVTEPGAAVEPIFHEPSQRMRAMAAPAGAEAMATAAPVIDLHPGTQEIRADVTVVFRISS